jgi:hypothetical protein
MPRVKVAHDADGVILAWGSEVGHPGNGGGLLELDLPASWGEQDEHKEHRVAGGQLRKLTAAEKRAIPIDGHPLGRHPLSVDPDYHVDPDPFDLLMIENGRLDHPAKFIALPRAVREELVRERRKDGRNDKGIPIPQPDGSHLRRQ